MLTHDSRLLDFTILSFLLLIGETEQPIRWVTRPLIDIITTLRLGKTNPGAVTKPRVAAFLRIK